MEGIAIDMIGSNVSTVGGIIRAFDQAQKWNCECIQIYTTLSRKWQIRKRTTEEIDEFKSAWEKSNVKIIVAHVPFLVNLATNDPNLYNKSVKRLIQELESADELCIDRVVLHPGSYKNGNSKDGLYKISDGIKDVFSKLPNIKTKILLETMAGQGTQIGKNFEELNFLINEVNDSRIGICCDTCHMYASGYDIRGYKGIRAVIKELDKIIGIDKIGAFHINDSIHPLRSGKDRHVGIGKGLIGLETFHEIVTDARFKSIPKIVENPNRDDDSLKDITMLFEFERNLNIVIDQPMPFAPPNQLELF